MDEHKVAAERPEEEPERSSALPQGDQEVAFALPAWLDVAIEKSQRSEPSAPSAETEARAPFVGEAAVTEDQPPWTEDAFLAATRDLGADAEAEPSSAASETAASDTTFSVPRSLFDENRDVPSFLPPRDRDRDRDQSPRIPVTPVEIATLSPQPNLALSWIVAALLLAGAAAAVLLTMHMAASRQSTTTDNASAPAPPKRRVGTVKAVPALTSRTVERTPLPLASPAIIAAPATTYYGINVGTFRSDERATSERARLASITGLPSRTVSANENGVALYRVVMGSFKNHEDAERASSDLIQHNFVPEAFVVPIADSIPAAP